MPAGRGIGAGAARPAVTPTSDRIGPFEVERAILVHPAVAEAAVVGVPDALHGQTVTGYAVLEPGRAAHAGSEGEIVNLMKARVGPHQQPRAVARVAELPKTETGKIQRFRRRPP